MESQKICLTFCSIMKYWVRYLLLFTFPPMYKEIKIIGIIAKFILSFKGNTRLQHGSLSPNREFKIVCLCMLDSQIGKKPTYTLAKISFFQKLCLLLKTRLRSQISESIGSGCKLTHPIEHFNKNRGNPFTGRGWVAIQGEMSHT